MTFRVGQKVVCVEVGPTPPFEYLNWLPGEAPEQGKIYTIHSTLDTPFGAAVRLCEIKRHPDTILNWGHDGYGAFRFRPIVERKTDISVLKALLVPGAKIREDA